MGYILFVFFLILNSTFIFKITIAEIQTFTLHKEQDCKDAGETYTHSVRNLKRISPIISCRILRCFCNHHGLWIFSTYKNFQRSKRQTLRSGSSFLDLKGKVCENRKLDLEFLQLTSIRNVGNSNTIISSLSLYSERDYFGSELFMTGTRLSLPSPQIFKSFGFTGKKYWSVFPLPNFNGNATCLKLYSLNSNLIHRNPNLTITVGSIISTCRNITTKISKQKPKPIKLYQKETGERTSIDMDSELYFDGEELKLPNPEIFIEFSIQGDEKWTIYAGMDFNGKSRCLSTFGSQIHENGTLRRFRFKRNTIVENLDFGETWLIGSLRRGCALSNSSQFEEDYEDTAYNFYEKFPGMFEMDHDSDSDWIYNKSSGKNYTEIMSSKCSSFAKVEILLKLIYVIIFFIA